MDLVEQLHASHVYRRRASVLSEHLASILPADASVLDVGTGDGYVASLIAARRNDLRIAGVDVLARPTAYIPVTQFDGNQLPFADGSFDAVMFVDVLHHTEDPLRLLREAARVARKAIVLKDHTLTGPLAGGTLRFMDRVGNARHGVALPFNYWCKDQWLDAFSTLGGAVDHWCGKLGLYWGPLSLLFDRSLHFVARVNLPHDAAGAPDPNDASILSNSSAGECRSLEQRASHERHVPGVA